MATSPLYLPNVRLQAQRLRRRMTQEDVAEELQRLAWEVYRQRVAVNANMVAKWEQGKKRPRPLYRELFRLLYNATDEQLGFRNPVIGSPLPAGLQGGRLEPVTAEPGDEDMTRRELLQRAAALAAAIFTPLDLLGEPSERLRTAAVSPSRLDSQTLNELAAMTARARRLDDRHGSRKVFAAVMVHLETVTGFLEGSQESPQRQRLVAIGGEVAQLAGWLSIDLRQYAAARVYFNLGINAAEEADDLALKAFILGNIGHTLSAASKPKQALGVLEAAQGIAAKTATATTRSWLAAVEAHAQAGLGATAACLAALDRAELAVADSEPAEDPAWMYFFDAGQLTHWKGFAQLRLGQAEVAQSTLHATLELLDPSFARERSVTLADLATAYIQQSEIPEGCRLAVEALSLGGIDSPRGVQRVRDLRRRLEPWRATVAVRELDEQLRMTAA
jgi:transcriptional regulator with XRE-family HTH domain